MIGKKSSSKSLYLYHSMPFDQVPRGIMVPDRKYSDPDFVDAYDWLAAEVGFFPIFLAVGNDLNDSAVRVTGYQNQWKVSLDSVNPASEACLETSQRLQSRPNLVLFAFEVDKVPVRSYHDWQTWHIVLSWVHSESNGEVAKAVTKSLFKRSWKEPDWLRSAIRDGQSVQVVTPSLDLDAAAFIWVRNEKTKRAMLARGFKNVLVKRISTDRF